MINSMHTKGSEHTPDTHPLEDADGTTYARLDLEREKRCGFAEVIFSQGKTPDQVACIAAELAQHTPTVLATRANREQYEAVREVCATHIVTYHESARIIEVTSAVQSLPARTSVGLIVVASAGTADLPVAEEAALTATCMGGCVERLYDVGIAGVHRVLEHLDLLRKARVIIAVAGMEGALPTLIAGLVEVPVVAVPTSVGYGANFEGIAPLLTMLNSCAGGVGVVNIDNGFGAALLATRINQPSWHDEVQ